MADLPSISLFTGAGGLDLGLHAAGFTNAVAVEMNDVAVRTLRRNRNRWGRILHGDVLNFIEHGLFERRADSILEATELRAKEIARRQIA